MIEISVKVSGDDRTLTHKFLLHNEGLVVSHDCEELKRMVNLTIENFKGEIDDVLVRIKYTW